MREILAGILFVILLSSMTKDCGGLVWSYDGVQHSINFGAKK